MAELLAIDPGPHTGLAWFDLDSRRLTHALTISPEVKRSYGPLNLYLELASRLDYLVYNSHASKVVVERFVSTQRISSAGLQTIKLIGFIEGYLRTLGIKCELQSPSVRKPYIADAKACEHLSDHEVSAIAHGLAYLDRLKP